MTSTSDTLTTQHRRQALKALVAAGFLGAALTADAQAQAQAPWKPSKTIRLIVPFAPGGASDALARLVAARLPDRLGVPVVVENKTGASGSIGSEFVYTAPPDGYTLITALADTHSMYPHLYKARFDATKFVPVAGFAKTAFVLMGRQDLPAANLKELLALAKKQGLSYSTAGAGSSLHVMSSVFETTAQLDKLVHVPYQGAGPAVQALAGGQVDVAMVPLGIAGPFRSRLKAYGVTTASRVEQMPDVPTLTEQGLPVVGESWMGMLAPPNTPAAITETLAKAVREIVTSPEFKTRVGELGMTPLTGTQAEFTKYYGDEYRKWGEVIRAGHMKID